MKHYQTNNSQKYYFDEKHEHYLNDWNLTNIIFNYVIISWQYDKNYNHEYL